MKHLKKLLGVTLAGILLVGGIAACAGDGGDDESTTTTTTTQEDSETPDGSDDTDPEDAEPSDDESDDSDPATDSGDPGTTSVTGAINVYSRDDASGTREAFSDVVGIDEDAGELVDTAVITSGNGDQAEKTGSDEQGIGYVALTTDFEASGIRPVPYEGVEPTEANVLSGDYKLFRPFSFVTRAEDDYASDDERDLTAAFVAFMTESTEGLEAIAAGGGIVDVASGTPWDELKADHPVVDQDNSGVTLLTAGSTSVEGVVELALSAFQPLAGNVDFLMTHTGSSDGYKRVMGEEKDGANAAHIGFASREFNDSEADVDQAMAHGEISKDAVVLVVPESNDLDNLTQQQVYDIYTGAVTEWENIGG